MKAHSLQKILLPLTPFHIITSIIMLVLFLKFYTKVRAITKACHKMCPYSSMKTTNCKFIEFLFLISSRYYDHNSRNNDNDAMCRSNCINKNLYICSSINIAILLQIICYVHFSLIIRKANWLNYFKN